MWKQRSAFWAEFIQNIERALRIPSDSLWRHPWCLSPTTRFDLLSSVSFALLGWGDGLRTAMCFTNWKWSFPVLPFLNADRGGGRVSLHNHAWYVSNFPSPQSSPTPLTLVLSPSPACYRDNSTWADFVSLTSFWTVNTAFFSFQMASSSGSLEVGPPSRISFPRGTTSFPSLSPKSNPTSQSHLKTRHWVPTRTWDDQGALRKLRLAEKLRRPRSECSAGYLLPTLVNLLAPSSRFVCISLLGRLQEKVFA